MESRQLMGMYRHRLTLIECVALILVIVLGLLGLSFVSLNISLKKKNILKIDISATQQPFIMGVFAGAAAMATATGFNMEYSQVKKNNSRIMI